MIKQQLSNPIDYTSLSDVCLRDAVILTKPGAWDELLRRYRALIYRCIHKTLTKFDNVVNSEAAGRNFQRRML